MSKYLPVLIVLSLASLFVSSEDFTEISEDVPQDVSAVFLPSGCTKSGKTPKTMFTLEPADDDKVTISTNPKDLVTFDRSGSRIYIQWNDDVAKDANEGGVRIFFPPDQLKQVDVTDKIGAQILDGFTSMESLIVSNKATLEATFTNLMFPIRMLSVTSLFAKGTVISNAGFEQVSVSSFANVFIQGDVQEQVSVSSYAGLTVRGSVNSGSVSSSAELYLDGDISGAFSASSSAQLSARSITGSVSASSSSTVYSSFSSDCENVETSSRAKCKLSDMDEVTVQIEQQPFTLEGADNKCYYAWTYVLIAASVSLVLVIVCLMICYWWRKRRRRRHSAGRSHSAVGVDKNGHAVAPLHAAPAGHHHGEEAAAEDGLGGSNEHATASDTSDGL
jgi:hypothetical protein